MTNDTPALLVAGISKSYNVPVLSSVHLQVQRGEVHALVGANGAGKSTLARVICGLTPSDSGSLRLYDEPYAPAAKADAEHAGVHIVQQELNVIPTLTVAENLYFNRLPRRFGFIARRKLHRDAARALEAVGLPNVHPDTPVSELGVGQQQLVEIAANLSRNLRLLILDEPTAMLTQPEIELLFARIGELKAAGVAIIYISHRMGEIRAIADQVSVLRDGQVVVSSGVADASAEMLMMAMTGSVSSALRSQKDCQPAFEKASTSSSTALTVSNLCRGPLTRNVSFDVSRGEIFGLSGLVGSGRTETLRAIFGADPPASGTVSVGFPSRTISVRSPRDAVRAGIGMLPEDRKAKGLLLTQTIAMNITLAVTGLVSTRFGWLSRQKERKAAEDYRERLKIKCSNIDQPVGQLSGGNQQKTLMARWLMRDCEVLLLDEPTRGIDVSARHLIYDLLRELAAEGKAIVVASSDLQELMELCDRVGVMSAGKLAAVLNRDEWSEEKILAASFSEYTHRKPNINTRSEGTTAHG